MRSLILIISIFATLNASAGWFSNPAHIGALEETNTPSGLTPGPAGDALWLKMDEGSGSTAHDSSSHADNGTLVNSPTWLSPNGLNFNSSSPSAAISVDVPDASQLQLTGNASISLWINPNATRTGSYEDILCKRFADSTPDGDNYEIYMDQASHELGLHTSALNTSSYVPTAGVWTHIVLVQNSGTFSFYINGAFNNSFAGSWGPDAVTADLFVGNDFPASSSPQQFNGSVSDVRFIGHALNTTEISNLYMYGRQ